MNSQVESEVIGRIGATVKFGFVALLLREDGYAACSGKWKAVEAHAVRDSRARLAIGAPAGDRHFDTGDRDAIVVCHRSIDGVPRRFAGGLGGGRVCNDIGLDELVGRTSLAYDLWGQAVNLAYQVSGVPQPGIYVTSQVYDAMRDSRSFVSAGEVTVDGTEQPIWRLSERQS